VREFVNDTTAAAPESDRPALEPLGAAADRLATAAEAFGRRTDALLASKPPDAAGGATLDRALIAAERAFLDPTGIPDRPWYRHLLYAPKPTYAAEVLPGVTEALEHGEGRLLEKEVRKLVTAIDRAAAVLARE
jgi:N-acetylated-alpha-linked acidic dipeptidase